MHEGLGEKGGGLEDEDIFENKNLAFFRFVTLPLEILDKTKLHPWRFHKIILPPWTVRNILQFGIPQSQDKKNLYRGILEQKIDSIADFIIHTQLNVADCLRGYCKT